MAAPAYARNPASSAARNFSTSPSTASPAPAGLALTTACRTWSNVNTVRVPGSRNSSSTASASAAPTRPAAVTSTRRPSCGALRKWRRLWAGKAAAAAAARSGPGAELPSPPPERGGRPRAAAHDMAREIVETLKF